VGKLSPSIWRRIVLIALTAVFGMVAMGAEQPPLPHIGVLSVPPVDGLLRAGLRERGYIEGKNIRIDWRSPYGSDQDAQSVAADLVREQVDVIVTFGTLGARRPCQRRRQFLWCFSAGDPVATGLADSLKAGQEWDRCVSSLH